MSDLAHAEKFRRIHIIGGPGSGKTALARRLGSYLGIPVYPLDEVAFEGNNFVKRPLAARLAAVHAIAREPAWISEGIFLWWTDELLQSADTIVWIDDVAWQTAAWRITLRFASGGLQEAQRQRGLKKFTRFRDYARNLRQLVRVLYSTRDYYTLAAMPHPNGEPPESSTDTARALLSYWDKVVHCRSARDVEILVQTMQTITAAQPAAKTL